MTSPRQNVDIAIIGLSCRMPGAASVDEFWKNLCGGVESVRTFSDQELIAAGVDPSLVANPNYVKAAPILRDVEMFDAGFFGYSPKDATLMDPQQRLFLEVCWEVFENAGYDPTDYPGKVGVIASAGGIVSTYLIAKMGHPDFPGQTASPAHINNERDFLSTRVSFKLNLQGPSFTLQSACSSSLVAVHQACQTLRFNECDMMLAGGSSVRVPQVEGYLAEKRNIYSLDGHCRPFDAAGQGTIFGSGIGAILLKPLDKAIADRDTVIAVIKGTAINNDGSAKISFTAPSTGQQSRAAADALELAAVSADSIGYVECHSTGTTVGDPLEIEALTTAFRKDTARKQYCPIGSVKANIGHPEQASGIAALIKSALTLHHRKIPPSINYRAPNSRIDFAASPFYVNTELRDFPLGNTPRRAGVNSLGIGGTNAFAVLEEAPPPSQSDVRTADAHPHLVTLSAKSADALVARVRQLLDWLNEHPDVPMGDLCYTTNVSRSQFAFRFAARAPSVSELKTQLAAWLQKAGEDAALLRRTSLAPVAFMFCGQGPQQAGMTAQLYRTSLVFRNAMDHCDALARPFLEKGLLDVIFARDGDDTLVNRTDYTQPALFAVEYALTELLKSWGITPNALIGHSLGEIAAACAADVFGVEDAMRLVIARGVLMHRVPSGGAMAAIWAEQSVVRALIDQVAPDVTVAAMNGPLNTVVSGNQTALKLLLVALDRQDIKYRELHISNGFHSPRTDPILDEFEAIAGELTHNAPRLPVISNLTGELMTAAPNKIYWRRHLREPVRFGDGMLALAKLDCRTFLELGPHPVLLPLAQACLGDKGKSVAWVATLHRQKPDVSAITEMLVALYLAGLRIDWAGVHADCAWRRIPLPTYPFQRQRYWIEDTEIRSPAPPVERPHPLVGARVHCSTKEIGYEAHYGVPQIGYLSDHRVLGTVVLPTTVEIEAATAAGRMHFGTSRISLDETIHHRAMTFVDDEDRTVRILLTPLGPERASFKLVSAAADDPAAWETHVTGMLRKVETPSASAFSVQQIQARCAPGDVGALYDRLSRLGVEHGPAFRGVCEVHVGRDETLTRVRLPQGLADARYALHPTFLDACLQAYPLVLEEAEPQRDGWSYLPISLAGYRCHQDGIETAWVHTRRRSVEKDGTQVVDVEVYDPAGRPVAEFEGLALRRLPLEAVVPANGNQRLFYRVAWREAVRPALVRGRTDRAASWIILADSNGVGAALAGRLEVLGHHAHLVHRSDGFVQRGPRAWTANERDPQDFRRLLAQLAETEALPCDGVVYLWGLDAPSIDNLTFRRLKSASEMMCRGALAILHALVEMRSKRPVGRLWFVTTNTQSPAGQWPVDPAQAPLWGLGRTIAIEHPGLWGGLIDMQLGDRGFDANLLAAELLDPDGETQIALSTRGQRYVPRLVEQSMAELPARPPVIRTHATYLVTGGLGMLGHSVARWLIAKGAKHLVLTGRHASPEVARELFNNAELNAADIQVVAADISREEDVKRLLQTIKELPPLRGVVHSAGVLDDGILAQLDWDRFAALFEPRVYGGFLLHEHTKSLELDFFILKSSLLSLLGSAGQANYTASSTFLDSLAMHRRVTGLPAMVINWCAWSEGGLATLSGARGEAMLSSWGMKFVSPDLGIRLFDLMMRRNVDQVAVVDADWPTFVSKVGMPRFLSELVNTAVEPRRPGHVALASTAGRKANGKSREQLSRRLHQQIREELGFVEDIDPDLPLNEIGLDSLMSVSLSNSLERKFGIPVPIAQLIRGPTINQLIASVFADWEDSPSPERNEPAEAAPGMPIVWLPLKSIPASEIRPQAQRPPAGQALHRFPPDASIAPATIAVPPRNGMHVRPAVQSILQRQIMAELGFDQPLDPDRPLNEVGLDSLGAVKLSVSLEREFGIPMSIPELIRGPTINELTQHLNDALAAAASKEAAGTDYERTPTSLIGNAPAHVVPISVTQSKREASHPSEPTPLWSAPHPRASDALNINANGFDPGSAPVGTIGGTAADRPKGTDGDLGAAGLSGTRTVSQPGKWLIAPQPNPNAKARLFCFPYAGGGLASFRTLARSLSDHIELVAVEAPGRGTRINETAVGDLDTFVRQLMPELLESLDRPSAFFGHCLGGLTMFATLCALPPQLAHWVKHAFACGVRPPHLLRRRGVFEDNLAYGMMLHHEFDVSVPPYAQSDDVFAYIIRQFDTPPANRMLEIPKLRKVLLPTIRAEFGMAYNYHYRPSEPFSFPLSSFVGEADPWVSEEDSAGWGVLTRSTFVNHVRKGSHFLMGDDEVYILQTIEKELAAPAAH
ncbi:type I polyketide synthase [Bradyrhizobium japonicum]|uniref:type I polyketide synthase n=1 Tax=Bradyrhizobium japonicum TaxID=375 RepID=UPI001E3B6EDC|nr:type I polyketide synthase [Bradyrhizobium japonicum]MCD9112969.1 SDR family NAD(P)-dependent oxidoreductase [Bradyrhizobium japonicum]MCD9825184.1 SDR family NAD(P)-dependent oxidoreductase [Bradyrhizobium japonicum]MCD9898106.1 SDR family NAD(P)-dependent oxidoreductase [Bradyrhizobium japonicum]MCS3979532.1 acyl transferase domain-containing protein/surfactin synthase thioesterase subunit/aryl carrier-like protein [Bradyrhizobium japonicum]MEB2672976.1 type I polyketide synthase [Bradyrh